MPSVVATDGVKYEGFENPVNVPSNTLNERNVSGAFVANDTLAAPSVPAAVVVVVAVQSAKLGTACENSAENMSKGHRAATTIDGLRREIPILQPLTFRMTNDTRL